MAVSEWPRPPERTSLRAALAEPGLVLAPGVTNPLEARLAAQIGFRAVYVTGAGIANVHFGVPDIGLITMSEALAIAGRIASQASVPVIADIDTGFGGPLQVQRTVREFERAGVSAVQIEDQVDPKRCGHFEGTNVVSVEVMVERIVAAVEARNDDELTVIARTDARASEGFEAALTRAQRYAEAGADVIFLEAPRTLDELTAVPSELDVPCLANMVEGGRTPFVGAEQLEAMGYRIALYANTLARLELFAARRGLATLLSTGTTDDVRDVMLTWDERQALVDLASYQDHETQLRARAGERAADGRERHDEDDDLRWESDATD